MTANGRMLRTVAIRWLRRWLVVEVGSFIVVAPIANSVNAVALALLEWHFGQVLAGAVPLIVVPTASVFLAHWAWPMVKWIWPR